MKRITVISAAAFMLAASAFSFTTATPAAAYGGSDRVSDRAAADQLRELLGNRIRSREELRDLILDRLQEREALRDLLADRLRGREDLRDRLAERAGGRGDLADLLRERAERRGQLRDLILDRLQERQALRELLGDRLRGREDLRDLLADRLERRMLLRQILAEHPILGERMGNQGDSSDRYEGAEENEGGATGISRADLRDLILDHVRSRGDVDQVLEQIHNRIEGGE